MQKLENWDFNAPINDEKISLINRQKSALMLDIVWIDYEAKLAEFVNIKSRPGRDVINTAALDECDCSDFRFAGKHLRKTLQPCMHIYRLAFELELLIPKHFSKVRYVPLTEEQKKENKRVRRAAMEKLWGIPKDPTQWGAWNSLVHVEKAQQIRVERALSIRDNEPHTIEKNGEHWVIHDYGVSFDGCDCDDFRYRKLPCKHMYTAALSFGINLELVD